MTDPEHDQTGGGIEIVLVGADPEDGGLDREQLSRAAAQLLDTALEPSMRDDRFAPPWPPDGLIAGLAIDGERTIGYLGGTVDRGRLQLAGLLAEQGRSPQAIDDLADRLWRAIAPAIEASAATSLELWAHPARPWHQGLADRHGLAEVRALHQLRCPLPVEIDVTPVPSRPFRSGQDEAALLRVNNRAFAAHPDQGGMTETDLAEAASQPWFDPDGIRLHDDPDRPGVLAGFCWTKIHEPTTAGEPRLGEIYAIGIDPDHHGKGLGVPMTAAGLAWLVDQGLTTGMLYVEADNEPALRTYDRLGFVHHRTDRAWRLELDS